MAVSKESNKTTSKCPDQNSPQTLISCGGLVVSSGIDTLHMTLNVHIHNTKIIEYLFEKKKEVQAGTGMEISIDLGVSGIFRWNLQRIGSKLYPFVLKNGDICLSLSTRKVDSQVPNAMLTIGSMSCNNNIGSILKSFDNWCSCTGIHIRETKVSRIDMYTDIKTDISATYVDYIKNYITKAMYRAIYYDVDQLTGVQIGRSDIVCRIYDKQLEMVQKGKLDKQAFFLKKWGLAPTDPVTRVEFQVRRKALTQFFPEKTDYKTVMNGVKEMWDYLTSDWLRHCNTRVDRINKNHQRYNNSEFWQIVVIAFEKPTEPIKRVRKLKVIDVTALKKQARGIMLSIAAAFRFNHDDHDGILATIYETVIEEIQNYMQDSTFAEKYAIKRARAVVSF